MGRSLAAEVIGTFWLVVGGCCSAVLATAFPNVGIGLFGVSLAFGLTVVTMAFALCTHRDRPGTDVDPPDGNPRNESVGEPGARHPTGSDRGRLGAAAR